MLTKRARPCASLAREHLGELKGVHAGSADVERLAGAHDVVQRAQRLFDRRVVIEAVDLIEVDVIGAEAAQAGVDGVVDVFAREAALVGVVAHRVEDLGGDDDAVARGEVLQRAAGDLFADAVGVHVGGVEEVDAGFQRAADEGPAFLFLQHPVAPLLRAVCHATETEAGDLKAGRAKPNVVHTSWIPRPGRKNGLVENRKTGERQ